MRGEDSGQGGRAVSSSPSISSFTLTGSRPSVATKAASASSAISIGPLSSETPRP